MPLSKEESAVAAQYAKWSEARARAKKLWDQCDREMKKLIRLAKLGRKRSKVVAISENRGVELTDKFKGEQKVFTPAFAHRWEAKEVPLENGN